jgi:FkbM family methyltransferase
MGDRDEVAGTVTTISERIAAMRADPTLAPLRRSLEVYYGDRAREAAMDALYARFLKPGELAFDIGAHVGDRIASFRRLGARVVALEPQPGPAAVLERLFGDDPEVTILRSAAAAKEGTLTLYLNTGNPTVSTASEAFVRAAKGAGGWEGQVWDQRLEVPATTLDALIARYGRPAFTKIDVEGAEDAVLAGLSQPLPALSFEFTTIQRDVAFKCLDRLNQLGAYRYDVALGEGQRLTFGRFASKEEMAAHILALAHEANSGDVYAVLA